MTMSTEDLGKSKFVNMLLKPAGSAMESRLRHLLQDPEKILRGADLQPGQTVLEVGSGTGFFSMAAARIIGDEGHLIAMDPLAAYVDRLNEKVEAAGLQNVRVVRRDALQARLDAASIDKVLLFGVLPLIPLRHPLTALPLNRLLPEMHRVLKPEGTLAVWMFPIAGLVPLSIRRSGLFAYLHKRNGVHNYRLCNAKS
jgi:ubiquinone/menaquinone biosynthesis C-methylase UbiE